MANNKIFMYMDWAERAAQESYCKRMKVGCVITTENLKDVLSYGYNGTLAGFPNNCENEDGSTNNSLVVHAEQNALDKLTASNKSAKDACVFITVAPCISCAMRLINVGVGTVYYGEDYLNKEGYIVTAGIELLKEAGLEVIQVLRVTEHLENPDHPVVYQIIPEFAKPKPLEGLDIPKGEWFFDEVSEVDPDLLKRIKARRGRY